MLELTSNLVLDEGHERRCYRHPHFSDQCVKVIKKASPRTTQRIEREVAYYKRVQMDNHPIQHVAMFYGMVKTNFGPGMVYELVKDFDGSISKTLLEVVKKQPNDPAIIQRIREIYYAFVENRIPVGDLHEKNILVCRTSDDAFELKLIDGFGNSDFIKYCDYSSYFNKKKLIRKFNRMLASLEITSPIESNRAAA